VYEREYNFLVAEGARELTTALQAVRVGDVAFGSVPGELFVEHGLRFKERSPFPFTYAVELANDYVGYLITPEAYEQGGYEACTLRSSKVTPAGVQQMIDKLLEMITGL
jgi:L-amino acid N-acyltransferase YncA